MTPPALVDITGDGVCDIVFASFNSTVVAIDGDTYKLLWSFSYPSSETYMCVMVELKLDYFNISFTKLLRIYRYCLIAHKYEHY